MPTLLELEAPQISYTMKPRPLIKYPPRLRPLCYYTIRSLLTFYWLFIFLYIFICLTTRTYPEECYHPNHIWAVTNWFMLKKGGVSLLISQSLARTQLLIKQWQCGCCNNAQSDKQDTSQAAGKTNPSKRHTNQCALPFKVVIRSLYPF